MKKRKKFQRLPSELKFERASTFSADVSREKHLPQFAIYRAQKIPENQQMS